MKPSQFGSRILAAWLLVLSVGCEAPPSALEDVDELTVEEAEINSAAVQIGSGRLWAHFTNPPVQANAEDLTILNEAVRLVRATPPGAQIRAAIHSLTVDEIASALIDAKKRGVTVYVVEDGKNLSTGDETPLLLARELQSSHRFCKDGTNLGCITSSGTGIMHTKLMLFSATTDPRGILHSNVSWFGSANMTKATGARTFNNTVTVYNDPTTYQAFSRYFSGLWSKTHYARNDYYDANAGRGYFTASSVNLRAYASPEQDSDLVHNRLRLIDASADCRIRVSQAMLFDSRTNLIDLLAEKKRAGCQVWVLGHTLQPEALAKLRGANIPVRTHDVHDKYILVDSRYAGSANNRLLVFTGSHNWTISANVYNDELFVRLESSVLYNAYLRHFNAGYDHVNAKSL